MRLLSIVILYLLGSIQPIAARAQSDSLRTLQLQSTKQFFMQALAQNSKDINALYNLANLYTELDDLDSAKTLLERAEKLDDKNAQVLTALGKVRIFQMDAQNLQRTFRFFEDAIKHQPDAVEPRFLLASSYISLVPGHGRLDEAERYLSEVDSLEPGGYDISFYSALMEYLKNNKAQATGYLEDIVRANPRHWAAQIRLGELYLNNDGDQSLGCQLYLQGLEHLQNRVELARIYFQLRPLLSKDDMERFQYLSHRHRGAWVSQFWRAQDPTPGTPENEYLQEFFRRRRYALTNFSTHRSLDGYDDRGRIYVKYGDPDDWHRAGNSAEFSSNESWTYYSINPRLRFDFIEVGGMYMEQPDLRPAMKVRRTGNRIAAADRDMYAETLQRLYHDRVDLGGVYAKIGMTPFENMGMDSNLDIMIQSAVTDQMRAVNEAPPNRFLFDYDLAPMDFLYDLAMFRGTEGRTRVEVYFSIPTRDLEFQRNLDGALTSPIDLNMVFQDETFVPLQVLDRTIHIQSSATGTDAEHYINQAMYHFPPDRYNFAISLKSELSKRWGIYKTPIRVPDFSGGDLMVSSIQLSHKIIEPPILNDKQIKGGIEILPHPYTGYTINEPPILYFEVYNLQVDDAGHAKYRTEVIVNQVKSTKNLRTIGGQLRTFKKEDASILLTDETEIAQQDDRRVLGLDITELTPGPVVITIKIEDLISGNTTETAQFFRVEKPVN